MQLSGRPRPVDCLFPLARSRHYPSRDERFTAGPAQSASKTVSLPAARSDFMVGGALVHRLISGRAYRRRRSGLAGKASSAWLLVRHVSQRICSLTPSIRTLLKPMVCLPLVRDALAFEPLWSKVSLHYGMMQRCGVDSNAMPDRFSGFRLNSATRRYRPLCLKMVIAINHTRILGTK